jgi:hypothetical protein
LGPLEPYRNVAQRLKKHLAVQDVENRIDKIVEQQQDVEPVSFIVLENSSGTGKTQMAFNLEASERYEVFYVLASPIDEGEQPVYTAFFSRTVTGLHQIVCHTQVMWGTLVMWRTHLAANKISVGGLTANAYALDWVPLC